MTITTTFRWNGKLGSDWDADVPNPPGPNRTNWDNISDPSPTPRPPSGAGDLAVIDLGGAISVTAMAPAPKSFRSSTRPPSPSARGTSELAPMANRVAC